MTSVLIRDIAEITNGKTPSKLEQRDKGFPVLKIKNIDENGYFRNNIESFVDQELISKFKNKIIRENDILILNAAHNASYVASKMCLADKNISGTLATGEWTIIRPTKTKIIPEYLYFWLNSKNGKANIRNIVKGIHLYPKDIATLKIPYISLDEQVKTVATIKQINAISHKRRNALSLLDEYVKSIFLEMFGDPVTNPKGWETKTIDQLVKKEKYSIKRGPFGGALKKEIFVESGYLVYEQFHALNNDFNMARYFIDKKKFNELKAFEVKAGDIIVSCSGVYLGKLAIVPNDAKKGIINQALLKITLDDSKMNSTLFIHIFSNKNFRNKYFGNQIGSGIPNFPAMPEFKKFKFIYPPIKLQNQFALIVEEIKAIKQKMLTQAELFETQFQSRMQKAFLPAN